LGKKEKERRVLKPTVSVIQKLREKAPSKTNPKTEIKSNTGSDAKFRAEKESKKRIQCKIPITKSKQGKKKSKTIQKMAFNLFIS